MQMLVSVARRPAQLWEFSGKWNARSCVGELLRESLRELWSLRCSSREMPWKIFVPVLAGGHLLNSEVNKRGRPSKWPPERLPSKFADFECAFSLWFLGENMTPKDPFWRGLSGTNSGGPFAPGRFCLLPIKIFRPPWSIKIYIWFSSREREKIQQNHS